jgi:hypothetical protein
MDLQQAGHGHSGVAEGCGGGVDGCMCWQPWRLVRPAAC